MGYNCVADIIGLSSFV